MAQTTADKFHNFDRAAVYQESLQRNLQEPTRSFVVEFSGDEARIAFNLSTDDVTNVLKEKPSAKWPVRWM
jgi:hypothetical protein